MISKILEMWRRFREKEDSQAYKESQVVGGAEFVGVARV